jgi:4-amino-4-deoxy-L-arabinose transferase-like glycosyltransferase
MTKEISLRSNADETLLSGRSFNISLMIIAGLGGILRVREILSGRSLWLDEAMLALNILDRSFLGLTRQPMEYGQSAPIGYVFGVKFFNLLLGSSEYALRLFSLLVGLASLVLMAWLAKKFLGRIGALIAMAFFSFAPFLIYYSAELKQYMDDVTAGLFLLFIFVRHIEKNPEESTWRDYLLSGLVGALLLWFSHPALFVAAGVGAILFVHALLTKDRRVIARTMGLLALWGLSIVVLYLVNLRYLTNSDLLLDYWEDGFMPMPPWSLVGFRWFGHTWRAILDNPLEFSPDNPGLVFLVFIIGFVVLAIKNWRVGAALGSVFLFALAASALEKYSLIGRMLLFLTPVIFLFLAAGIDGIGSLIRNKWLGVAVKLALAGYFMFIPVKYSIERFITPKIQEHIKPTMEYLQENYREGDKIYVYYYTEPAFRFYAPKFGFERDEYIAGEKHQDDPEAYLRELDALAGAKRVWLIFSHVYFKDDFNEQDYMLAYLDEIGEKTREYRVPRTAVNLYLYDLK